MNCIKHGTSYETGFCPVCTDLEIADELKWEEDIELQEDLEDTAEYAAGLAARRE